MNLQEVGVIPPGRFVKTVVRPDEAGIDTVYFFDLPVAAAVDIFIDAPFDEVAYLRRADDADGCARAADLECEDRDPARIRPADPLPPGRYYLVIDAEFGEEDAAAAAIDIFIRAAPIEDPPANDTCVEVLDHRADWVAFLADEDAGVDGLALPEGCIGDPDDFDRDDPPIELGLCGLLDPILAVGDRRVVAGGNAAAALPHYDVRPHDPGDDATCEADGGQRDASAGRDVAFLLTVESPSELAASFNNIDLGNGLIHLRRADGVGGCGDARNNVAAEEMYCGDEPAIIEVERLDPGAYFLIVDGFNAAASGQFALDVALSPLPLP